MGELIHLNDAERAEAAELQAHWAEQKRVESAIANGGMDWESLEPETPPERDWAIAEWFGMGYVTLLAGPGGSGKTAVMQTILSALSLGRDVIGNVIKPRRCAMLFGEDDSDEVWRRQVAIARWLNVPLSAFRDRFYAFPRPSDDITLAVDVSGTLVGTPEFSLLKEQTQDLGIEAWCLDSVARIYGGRENDRHQVTQFLSMMNSIVAPTKGGIVLVGHPAKADGSEFSGSTAWEASVRARMYFGFKLPDVEQDPLNPPDMANPIRYLAKRKTNYSVKDYRVVKWIDGAMIPQTPDDSNPITGRTKDFLAEEALHLLRRLKVMGIETSHAPNSSNYLPKAAQNAGLLNESLTVRDVKVGLSELLRTSRVQIGDIGFYPNRSPKKGLVEAKS